MYFDASGAPAPLPDNVLPPAFKEWGQVLVDWQSQCAMRVDPDDRDAAVYARELRFLPTAGCEADSSTVETAYARTIPAADVTPAPADAAVAPGTYSAGPTRLPAAAAPPTPPTPPTPPPPPRSSSSTASASTTPPTTTPARASACSSASRSTSTGLLAVADVSAWKEYYYEPSPTPPACARGRRPEQVGAPSRATRTTPTTARGNEAATATARRGGFAAGAEHLAMLPAGVWSAAWREAGGGFALEAGWVIPVRDAAYLPQKRERETLVASRRRYDAGGELVEAAFFQSTRPPRPTRGR